MNYSGRSNGRVSRLRLDQDTPYLRRALQRTGMCSLIFAFTVVSAVSAQLDEWCYWSVPSKKPQWVTSGSAVHGKLGIWVVDADNDHILNIEPNGEAQIFLEKEGVRQIRALEELDGYLVLRYSAGNLPEIWRYDQDLDLEDQVVMEPRTVHAIYDYTSLGPGVLAFGDITAVEPSTALFYLGKTGKKEIFLSFNPEDEILYNYITDNTQRFLARVGRSGYILVLDQRPWIGKVEVGVEGVTPLPFFPEDFRYYPRVASTDGWRTAGGDKRHVTAFFEIVENKRLAAGLFDGFDGYLYLLGKSARNHRGATQWWLVQLDPEDGQERRRILLPVPPSTAHLTVVPGKRFWTLIEKGPVKAWGSRGAPLITTGVMTLIPSKWFDESWNPDTEPAASDCRKLHLP